MELHSYAKRRASRKWNIEQKRKLVETRISHDSWFNNRPSNSMVPWKKVLSVAKLDDFNVFFVRKQWSNMLTKYKLYKKTRLDGIGGASKSLDMEIIKRINQEWEFFGAIHTFMTRKTTNLHSYAVTQKYLNTTSSSKNGDSSIDPNNVSLNTNNTNGGECGGNVLIKDEVKMSLSLSRTFESSDKKIRMPKETAGETTAAAALLKLQLNNDCVKENIPNNATILLQEVTGGTKPNVDNVSALNHFHSHDHYMFSSDTNEEYEVICSTELNTNDDIMEESHQSRNTDHDFYSKNMAEGAAAVADCRNDNAVADKFSIDEHQLHYFADASEESMGTEYVYQNGSTVSPNFSLPSVMENIEIHTDYGGGGRTFENKPTENVSKFPIMSKAAKKEYSSYSGDKSTRTKPKNSTNKTLAMPATLAPSLSAAAAAGGAAVSKPNKMTERDKYYRHKRRFNRRLEKRFDAVLQVFGQAVKCEYPEVNIKPLMDTINATASGLNGLLNSESDDDDDDDDDEDGHSKNET